MLKLIGATDWERGVDYLIRIKQEGPSPGRSDSKNEMLISKAVHELVGNKARRPIPDDNATELDFACIH